MIDYDEGDKGEWTKPELEKRLKQTIKEVFSLRNENRRLKDELKKYKTISELWERAAKRIKQKTMTTTLLPLIRVPVRRQLKDGVIYSHADGRLVCSCCYQWRPGLVRVPLTETIMWRKEFGTDMACECGKTIYLQPT